MKLRLRIDNVVHQQSLDNPEKFRVRDVARSPPETLSVVRRLFYVRFVLCVTFAITSLIERL